MKNFITKGLQCSGPTNWRLKLRLSLILLFISLLHMEASTYSQNTKITLDAESVSVESVLKMIESQSEFKFFCNVNMVDVDRIVTIKMNKQRVFKVLKVLFKDTNTIYDVVDRQIILTNDLHKNEEVTSLALKKVIPIQQEIEIVGTVKDSDGIPLPDASIIIKGTSIGVVSDFDGNFKITVPNTSSILVISYIGMTSQEVVVGNQTTIDIVLAMSAENIDEIVVTALGIKREEKSLGYSVQKISGDELQKVKGVNIATSLTGKVAGLTIKNSTEFNEAPDITIRGAKPLLVIDGVPYGNMDLNNISPDDIESMSVLKGATASALYGTRGGNGAIIITTKNSGKGITINSNTMFFAGYLALPEVQHSYSAGYGGVYSATDYVWGDKLDIGRMYDQWNPETKQIENMPLTSRGKDNFENFLEPGFVTNNNVSLSHTGENGSIRASFTHVYNKGQYPNLKSNSLIYSLSGKLKIGEKFDLQSQIGYNRSDAPQTTGAGYGSQGYIYQILIWTGPEYDLSKYRDYWVKPDEVQNWHYHAWYDNPYLIAYEKLDGEEKNVVNTSFTANYQLFEDAKLTLRLGYDFYSNKNTKRNPMGIHSTRGWHSNGMYGEDLYRGYSLNNDLIFSYNKDFGDFGVDFLAGASIYKYEDESLSSYTRGGIVIPGFYSLNNSVERPDTWASTYGKQVNSTYGKLSLSYDKKLYLDVTGRNDWSSTLPSDTRSFFYPSVAGSVIIDEFFNNPSWLDFWKARASWTISKKDLSVYATNQSYDINTGSWDGLNTASYPTSIKNSAVEPETNRTFEIGTAAYMFKKRLKFDLAYYNIYNYNIQRSAPVSSTSGFYSTLINIDETYERKGFEATLGGTVIKRGDFSWNVIFNISKSHNYYKSLDPVYSADNLWTKVGERTDPYVDRKWETSPDGRIVIASDGRGVYTDNRYLWGYEDPDFIWGINNSLAYKDFTFNISIDGRHGGMMFNYTPYKMWDTGAHPDSDNEWRYEEVVNGNINYVGDGVNIVSGEVVYDRYGQIVSDTRVFQENTTPVAYASWARRYVDGVRGNRDASFFKIREIALGYTLPRDIAKKLNLSSARIALTAQNVFLWSKEVEYADPDVGSDSQLTSPSQRYMGVNIQLSL